MSGLSRKGNQRTHSYWMRQGLTKDEAKAKVKEIFTREKETKIKELGSENAYMQYMQARSCLAKQTMLKKFKSEEEYMRYKREVASLPRKKHYRQAEYWVEQGYPINEAKEIATSYSKATSHRCVEFWLAKGYSREAAQAKVSAVQSLATQDKFILRYGEKEGTLRYQSMVNKQKETTVFKDSELQKTLRDRTRQAPAYWMKRGASYEEAKHKARRAIQERSRFSKAYWIKQGLSEEEAKDVLSSQSKRASQNVKHHSSSKLEEQVFNYIKTTLDAAVVSNPKVEDIKVRRAWYPDIVGKNYIIEVLGDYWHANPLLYAPDAVMYRGHSAKRIWVKDKKRFTRLQNLTGKKVYCVWEKDIREKGFIFVNELFIKEGLCESKESN